jgi:hypothetical protein
MISLLKPWRDSNPGLLPEADAMSTAPCQQGKVQYYDRYFKRFVPLFSETIADSLEKKCYWFCAYVTS